MCAPFCTILIEATATATMYPQRGMSGIVLGMTKAQVRTSRDAVRRPGRLVLASERPGTRVTDFLIGRGLLLEVTIALLAPQSGLWRRTLSGFCRTYTESRR